MSVIKQMPLIIMMI